MININIKFKYNFKKSFNKKIRKEGLLPGIIYGKGKIPIPIILKKNIINIFNKSEDILNNKINLIMDKFIFNVKIKDIQYHFYKNEYIHIDFIFINN